MANLWRTQRPRFPQYTSDGSGRDYYIKFNNAGYWDDQFKIQKKPEYEYPKYNNFHSLFHQAAPVKYIPTGNGRETYIINEGGQYHDEKPLSSFKLDDFLRESKTIENSKTFKNRKHYKSLGEKSYNNKLKSLEKELINRLYKIPMRIKKNKKEENENILPNLDNKNHYEKNGNDINDINDISNNVNLIGVERFNTEGNERNYNHKYNFLNRNNKRKINKISLKYHFDTILKQSQQIENYEMNNNSRRNNNESDYNIYKNGRIGCRLNKLKSLINCPSENFNGRINTEGNLNRNKIYSLGKIKNKNLKRNKLTFSIGSGSEENRFKTLDY